MHPTMGRLRALFESGLELTAHDVEARLFIDVRNGREYLKILWDQDVVFIARWRRDTPHGRWTPVYRLKAPGDRDAPKPAKITAAQSRRKIRANPQRWEDELKAARVRYHRAKADPIQLDPLMAAVNRDATMTRL